MRVFLDACILYAAIGSHKGGSAKIILEAKERGFTLVSTSIAFEEIKGIFRDPVSSLIRIFRGLHSLISIFFSKGQDD